MNKNTVIILLAVGAAGAVGFYFYKQNQAQKQAQAAALAQAQLQTSAVNNPRGNRNDITTTAIQQIPDTLQALGNLFGM